LKTGIGTSDAYCFAQLKVPKTKRNWIMKIFAIINRGSLALAILLVAAAVPALGQGTLIIQHSGATDPVTEGFTRLASGTGYPVINDMGVNAWVTPGISNQNVIYNYVLTPQQQAESVGASWILSADLRITTTNSSDVFDVGLEGYNGGYGLYFGSDSNGDQYVQYGSGSADRVTLDGSGYHNYQLIYNASSDMTSLWIDGLEYATNNFIGGIPDYLIDVSWGSGYYDGQNALANWNSVSLEITPEPGTVALFGLGALIVAAGRFRKRP
jgi:hypothetical protein